MSDNAAQSALSVGAVLADAPVRSAQHGLFRAFLAAIAIVLGGPFLVLLPPSFDALNAVPAAATLFVVLCVAALPIVCGHLPSMARALARTPGDRPWWWLMAAAPSRAILLVALLPVAGEYALRCGSYHRSVYYERQGDLLFTPIPNQEYVEKISLTWSRIDDLGLRWNPAAPPAGDRTVILCLGDSITYGYGVSDADTYPALLQRQLEDRYPGRFLVLNGGVNAYPIALMHQKFLYLWDRGVRPEVVVVGYSMNEGWLGHLVTAGADAKDAFEGQVLLKNVARRSGLYNLVVENWARSYYDSIKAMLVPGTNSLQMTAADRDTRYEASLERLVMDLDDRGVRPLFVTFASFNFLTGRFDTEGEFQRRFIEFARMRQLPVLRSDDMLRGAGPDRNLAAYFIDHGHMTAGGNARIAGSLAGVLPQLAPGRR